MKIKNPFTFPVTNRGQRQLEMGIVAAGIAIAILAVWFQFATRPSCGGPELDRLGLLIELSK
jgi:hypothetical protein